MTKLQVVLVFDIKPRHGGSPRWDIQRRVDGARGETKGGAKTDGFINS